MSNDREGYFDSVLAAVGLEPGPCREVSSQDWRDDLFVRATRQHGAVDLRQVRRPVSERHPLDRTLPIFGRCRQ